MITIYFSHNPAYAQIHAETVDSYDRAVLRAAELRQVYSFVTIGS
jgi:hypothetical protein